MIYNFLIKWFKGPLGLDMCLREIGVSKAENRNFRREIVSIEALKIFFDKELMRWRRYNWYMSNAMALTSADYDKDKVFYDRISFDFDSKNNKREAVDEALEFAQRLEKDFETTPIVVDSGFKGAHVHVFLKEIVSWSVYELLYDYLLSYVRKRSLVDKNMLEWNRLARIPYTMNIKSEIRATKIIYPVDTPMEDFDWSFIKPMNLIKIPVIKLPELPKPIIISKRESSSKYKYRWIEKIIERGLPDGRKRFILYVLSSYLVNVLSLSDDEAITKMKDFLDASCRNFGNCKKIYDSWLRSDIKRMRKKGYMPTSLSKIKEKDSELYSILEKILSQ
jgi:hypothetical protein